MSNDFAEYKPKYFSRCDKSAKSTYFRKNSYKFFKYLSTECGEISSEVRENKTLNIIIIIISTMKKSQEFQFLSVSINRLPPLRWTQKCEF